jgi:hypothetical protein
VGESDLVQAFNDYFERNGLKGLAYRRKQHRFSSQFLDIIVNSADCGHLAVEHKSFKTESSNKLYFSQHFSEDTSEGTLQQGHQIDRVEEFRRRSGLDTYLIVEIRKGAGIPKQCFALGWERVHGLFELWKDDAGPPGFDLEWFEDNAQELPRNENGVDGYQVSGLFQ